MANSNTEFSFAVPLRSDEERAWGTRAVAYLNHREACDFEPAQTRCTVCDRAIHQTPNCWDHDDVGEDEAGHRAVAPIDEMAAVLPDDIADQGCLGYQAEVDTDGLWIYAEECGTPDNVIPLVQEYLRQFLPDGHVHFGWADTCTKMRLDQFGGGAVFITATDATFMTTYQWMFDQAQAAQA